MSLVKRTYVDQETVITAENLNAIQDAIIENEEAIEDQGEAIEGKYTKPSGGIPASDMASGVQTSLGKAESAYQKPSGGIPASDMASGVQTSLGKAESAYQKPSGGIPASDMASGVQTSLGKADSALQAVPNTYRTAAAQDLIDADKVDKADYNPESKTSAMTQPVGLDANGKLWTQPPAAAAQSDWSETDTTSPAFIKNKPTIPDISQLESDVQDLQSDLAGLDAGDVAYDNSLTYAAGTVGKELGEQRNTLNHKADVIYDTAFGSIASFPDGADGLPVKDLTVSIEPVQDLHGYDNPWPAGGGKNLLDPSYIVPYEESGLKVVNNAGVMSISGTVSASFNKRLATSIPIKAGTYIFSKASTNIYPQVLVSYNNSFVAYVGATEQSFTIASDGVINLDFYTAAGTYSDTFKLMIRLFTVSDATFAPYSNICPISGWTGCDVTRTGKNPLKTYTRTEIKASNTSGTWSGDNYAVGGVTFACKFSPVDERFTYADMSGTAGGSQALLWVSSDVSGFVGNYYLNGGISNGLYITAKKNGSWIGPSSAGNDIAIDGLVSTDTLRVCCVVNANNVASGAFKPMLRLSTISDATFAPYTGTTIPISWQSSAGTVYGGTLDVTSGVLTVSHGIKDLGSLDWTRNSSSVGIYYFKSSAFPIPMKNYITPRVNQLVCSTYKAITDGRAFADIPDDSIYDPGGENVVCVRDDSYTDADVFKSAMSGVQLVYKLATPQTYQLTPQEVTTLLGQNNIWADTGDSTVEYPCDTKLYIDKKLAALVAALS